MSKEQSDIVMQDIEDTALVERIFPDILAKLDGPTILKKVDGKQLLEKVLPYLDIKVNMRGSQGTEYNVKLGTTGSLFLGKTYGSAAQCGQAEIPISGGFVVGGDDTAVRSFGRTSSTGWSVTAHFGDDGRVQAFAECMTIQATAK